MNLTVEECYEKSLGEIIEQIKTENFSGCTSMATDMVRASILFENTDGVLVGEVLEAVFLELHSVMKNYEISKDKRSELIKDLVYSAQELANSFKNKNNIEMYNNLKNIRYIVTKFQFKAIYTLPKKKSSRIVPMRETS